MKILVFNDRYNIYKMAQHSLCNKLYHKDGMAKEAFYNSKTIKRMAIIPKIGWAIINKIDGYYYLNTFVHIKYRRQGIGTKLVMSIIDFNEDFKYGYMDRTSVLFYNSIMSKKNE